MTPVYGARKDKYEPDVLHRPIGAAQLLAMVNNKELTPSVRSQGSLQACVGYSIGAQLSMKAKKQGVYSEWFSPKWIWNGARYIEGWLTHNSGCYPRDAFDWLQQKGCLLESHWPINELFFDPASPPSAEYPDAAKYPLIDRRRVTGSVDDICSAIMTNDAVSIGTPWFPQWETVGLGGKLSMPLKTWSLPADNWHETLLYGYDRAQAMFYGQNSWGLIRGNMGHFAMPFESFNVFNSFGGWDAMYAVVPSWPAEPKIGCWQKLFGGKNDTTVTKFISTTHIVHNANAGIDTSRALR